MASPNSGDRGDYWWQGLDAETLFNIYIQATAGEQTTDPSFTETSSWYNHDALEDRHQLPPYTSEFNYNSLVFNHSDDTTYPSQTQSPAHTLESLGLPPFPPTAYLPDLPSASTSYQVEASLKTSQNAPYFSSVDAPTFAIPLTLMAGPGWVPENAAGPSTSYTLPVNNSNSKDKEKGKRKKSDTKTKKRRRDDVDEDKPGASPNKKLRPQTKKPKVPASSRKPGTGKTSRPKSQTTAGPSAVASTSFSSAGNRNGYLSTGTGGSSRNAGLGQIPVPEFAGSSSWYYNSYYNNALANTEPTSAQVSPYPAQLDYNNQQDHTFSQYTSRYQTTVRRVPPFSGLADLSSSASTTYRSFQTPHNTIYPSPTDRLTISPPTFSVPDNVAGPSTLSNALYPNKLNPKDKGKGKMKDIAEGYDDDDVYEPQTGASTNKRPRKPKTKPTATKKSGARESMNQPIAGTSAVASTSTTNIVNGDGSSSHSTTTTGGSSKTEMKRLKEEADRKCDLCQKIFSRNADLIRHTETVHEKKRKVRCGTCQKVLSREDALGRHLRGSCHPKPDKNLEEKRD